MWEVLIAQRCGQGESRSRGARKSVRLPDLARRIPLGELYQKSRNMVSQIAIIAGMEDLDVARLAEYLHLTPEQVTKMAVRGKVPARKVGGVWRFNEAEIHHWLEDRIGVSDSQQLVKVQQVLDRVAGEVIDRPIHELCTVETTQVPLNAQDSWFSDPVDV